MHTRGVSGIDEGCIVSVSAVKFALELLRKLVQFLKKLVLLIFVFGLFL